VVTLICYDNIHGFNWYHTVIKLLAGESDGLLAFCDLSPPTGRNE